MTTMAHQRPSQQHAPARSERRKPCRHADSFPMPSVRGRQTTLCRCRTCNRDFDYDTGFMVEYVGDAYRYRSSRRPPP